MGFSSSKTEKGKQNEEKNQYFYLSGVIPGSKKERPYKNISYSINENAKTRISTQIEQPNEQKKKSSNYQNEYYSQSFNYPQSKEQNPLSNSSNENKQWNNPKNNLSKNSFVNGGMEIPNKNINKNNNTNEPINNKLSNELNYPEIKDDNYEKKFTSELNGRNKNVNINDNISLNSNQNIVQKNNNINFNENNNKNNNNEISAYPNLDELNYEKNLDYEKKDNIDVLDSKDDSFDTEIPIFKPMDIEVFSDVEKFMRETNIQDDFNEKDENEHKTFKELKKYEKEKLKKIFLNIKEQFEKINLNKKNLVIKLNSNLISDFIINENTKSAFKYLIIKEIELIKSDEKKYKIGHLTILLVGKARSGKKSLIKYMLNLDDSQLKVKKGRKKEDFQAFQNPKIPHLRLVKYKGIGLGKENEVETITNQTINYINKQMNKGGYNDFVHCIWYCVSGTKMEPKEDEYLLKLRSVYSNVDMPIIIIYLDEYRKSKIDEMKAEIQKVHDVDFINVVSKIIKKPKNSGIVEPRGGNELMNLTIAKCRSALKGHMPKIMMKNISNDILYKMKNLVETKKIKVKDGIKEKFINEFKNVLKDNELIEYIINLLGRYLSIFYERNISNKSLNLIINSEIISSVKSFLSNCKEYTINLISSDIVTNAKEFIDVQASLEKKNKENINIENKRTLKGFIKTNEIFLKKNFYYISQKYIIYYFILFFCNDYFNEFQKQFNEIITNLINQDENSDINIYIADCFASKLKKFGEKIKINFEIEKYENNNLQVSFDNNFVDDNLLIGLENEGDNSFDMIYEEEEELMVDDKEENEKIINKNLTKFFKLNNDWKYINKDLSLLLFNFLNNFKFKDTLNNYFKRNNYFNNSLLNSLKEYEQNILELFLKNNIQQFLNVIDENFKKINEKYELIQNKKNMIKKILENEGLEKIQLYKIKKEFDELSIDLEFKKIGYLTIIVIGKTGVGKSTLINTLLKEYCAKEQMKKIGTQNPGKYENKKVPFLKLIDSRGIEIQSNYGVSEISEEIIKIINDPKELEKYENENFQNFMENNKEISYNDYVQCVWYCVTGKNFEKEEKEFIERIRMQKNKIPIIIVYTISEDEDKMQKVRYQVNNYFKDIPYVEILSRGDDEVESFGLDELINITIENCKSSYGSKTFDEMKKEINQTLINNLKNKNKNINCSVNIEAVSHFMNNYDKNILDNNQFKKYIYYIFAILFNGYFKIDKESEFSEKLYQSIIQEFNNSNISNYLNEIINCYQKISEKFIDKIKEEKAIQFLDKQALYEKRNNNLDIRDKCNKFDFIKIIESFLKNNFHCLAQKFFIYKFFINIIEQFSEIIENEVNENLINVLNNNSQIFELFKNIYSKKIDDLNKTVQEFLKEEGYHKSNKDIEKSCVVKKEKKDDIINVNEIDSISLGEEKENFYMNDYSHDN